MPYALYLQHPSGLLFRLCRNARLSHIITVFRWFDCVLDVVEGGASGAEGEIRTPTGITPTRS